MIDFVHGNRAIVIGLFAKYDAIGDLVKLQKPETF